MSKTSSTVLTGIVVTFIIFVAYTLTTNVYSDTRDTRERETGRVIEPPPSPPIEPPLTITPPPSSGGITSSTVGSVSTGNNTGGQVITGDEHVEVFEVNIGPTNPPANPPANTPTNTPTPSSNNPRSTRIR